MRGDPESKSKSAPYGMVSKGKKSKSGKTPKNSTKDIEAEKKYSGLTSASTPGGRKKKARLDKKRSHRTRKDEDFDFEDYSNSSNQDHSEPEDYDMYETRGKH